MPSRSSTRRSRPKASGLAHARLLLRTKLGWLCGFPTPAGWTVVPEHDDRSIEHVSLDRNTLRRATYTANRLRSDFPRALPALVGDADAWRTAVDDVLARLKPWVHQGQAPPPSLYDALSYSRTARARARALRSEHPTLGPLVDAVSWVRATQPEHAPKDLAWIEREAAALMVLLQQRPDDAPGMIALAIECMVLARSVGPKALRPLMELLTEPAVYTTPLHGSAEYLRQSKSVFGLKRVHQRPETPKSRFWEQVPGWIRWLRTHDRAVARRFLGLLAACDLAPVATHAARWWSDVQTLINRAYGIQLHRDEPERRAQLDRVDHALSPLTSRPPQSIELRGLTPALTTLATVELGYGAAAMRRLLDHLRGHSNAALRAGLLMQWADLHTAPSPWWDPRRLPRLLRAHADYLRDCADVDAAMKPWRRAIVEIAARGEGGPSIDRELLDGEELEPADIGRFFEVLLWIETHEPSVRVHWITMAIVRLLRSLHDASICARLALALLDANLHEQWLSPEVLRASWRCCEPQIDGFADLVVIFDTLETLAEIPPTVLLDALMPALGDDRALLRMLLLDEDRGSLLQCGRKLALLHALGRPVRIEPETQTDDHAWFSSYPEALRDDLARLARQTTQTQARTIAARVLRSVRHDLAAMKTEREALEAQLPAASSARAKVLRKRLATLAARVDRVPTVSATKLMRLQDKLRRRGGLERLRAVEQAADATLPDAIARALKLRCQPPWLLEERVLRLLLPLLSEGPQTRRLARLLLEARAGDPPWDLRDHPANAAFIDDLRERKIDPRPWLDDLPVEDTPTDGLRLSLEDDPIEVLHMGRHFATCLSPGHSNFFSTFANAADINKRVLYGRDDKGQVQARRLLCLTASGALLTFGVYAHIHDGKFDARSDDYIRRLAAAMGTDVVGRGSVPTLVASQWYDDGAVDIAGRFDALDDDSPFREALGTVSPDQLPSLLNETFGRSSLDESLAPMLIELPEFQERPWLVGPLLTLVRHPERLPPQTCLTVGQRLARVDTNPQTREPFIEPIARALWQYYREHDHLDIEIAEYLAKLDPSGVLRMLRATRASGVRRWDDERQIERLYIAGISLEQLARPKQAAQMYRRALKTKGYKYYRQMVRDRLGALES